VQSEKKFFYWPPAVQLYGPPYTLHFLLSQICGGLCQTRKTPTLDGLMYFKFMKSRLQTIITRTLAPFKKNNFSAFKVQINYNLKNFFAEIVLLTLIAWILADCL
jgi:hypothetical protein